MAHHSPKLPGRSIHGFTLLEVMVAVAIVGILSLMASTSLKRYISRMKVLGAVDDLRNAFQVARADATTNKHHSGVLLEVTNLRYLRFIDSTTGNIQNGRYASPERIVQGWTSLPATMVFYSIASSISPAAAPRTCGVGGSTSSSTAQSGQYSIVFRPDGSSWASFSAKMSTSSFSDTLTLSIVPPTGYVDLEK